MALDCILFLPHLLLIDTSETHQNDKLISKSRLIVWRSNFLIFIPFTSFLNLECDLWKEWQVLSYKSNINLLYSHCFFPFNLIAIEKILRVTWPKLYPLFWCLILCKVLSMIIWLLLEYPQWQEIHNRPKQPISALDSSGYFSVLSYAEQYLS